MEHAGWQLAGGLLLTIISWFLGRVMAPKNDCSKCGIAELKLKIEQFLALTPKLAGKSEMLRLCNVVEALAERAGMSVKERLEIERIDTGGA